MSKIKTRLQVILLFLIVIYVPLKIAGAAIPDIYQFERNFNNRENQTALTGSIDSLMIVRPNVEFRLGPGKITLLDFGASRPCAMIFQGEGNFKYVPPNDIEREQLIKFTDKETLNEDLTSAVFVFTGNLENLPDTSSLIREELDKKTWNLFSQTVEDAFERMGIYLPNMIIGDLMTEFPGFYLYSDFELKDSGRFAFIDDPSQSDQYRLYKRINIMGFNTFDRVAGYSLDDGLVSHRGMQVIDITNYKIKAIIADNGKTDVECRIEYTPNRWGYSYLYFEWYYENKDIVAVNSSGDTLDVINKKDEWGFGVVLKEPLEIGKSDYIDISYKFPGLKSSFGLFYVVGKTSWYPANPIRDKATYDLEYHCSKYYDIISCGERIDIRKEDDRAVSHWLVDPPVEYISFNLGVYKSKETVVEGLQPVKVFVSDQINHKDLANISSYFGHLSNKDMLEQVSADITNSLSIFSKMFGPCPFDTIKTVETPSVGEGQGSPGLIYLSWDTFQYADIGGSDLVFHAHEVAHQWWGHVIDVESYRDTWITEGLANYCGLWFCELSTNNREFSETILKGWRRTVIPGESVNYEGSTAGPVVLGYRLSSTKSPDYYNLVYRKGGYIFHMLRYLLHDYKTGSDSAFAGLLNDLASTYKNKIITTPLLKKLVEKHVGADMTWFFDQWVYGTAIPEYEFSYDITPIDGGKFGAVCHIKQKKVPEDFGMMVPLTVLFDDDRYVDLQLWIDQPQTDIELPKLPLKPKKLIFNAYDAVLCKVDNK